MEKETQMGETESIGLAGGETEASRLTGPVETGGLKKKNVVAC